MKVYTIFVVLLLFTATAFAQNTINNYRYVLVPERFDFFKMDNQYGLNTLTKLLLDEKGFTAFVGTEEMPPAVVANKCNALKAEVVQKKGLFVTNLTLVLKDCQGNIVFKSKEGKSREKEFQTAYDLALRDAFTSFNDVPYKYDSTTITQAQPQQPAVAPLATTTPPPPPLAPAPAQAPTAPAVTDATGTLYAQPTPTGYQLIDTTPQKVLTLFKTSVQDHFIGESGSSNGIVFKKDGEWFFEYYKDNKLTSLKLQIKF